MGDPMGVRAKVHPMAQASATLCQMEKQQQNPPLRAPVIPETATQASKRSSNLKTGTAS